MYRGQILGQPNVTKRMGPTRNSHKTSGCSSTGRPYPLSRRFRHGTRRGTDVVRSVTAYTTFSSPYWPILVQCDNPKLSLTCRVFNVQIIFLKNNYSYPIFFRWILGSCYLMHFKNGEYLPRRNFIKLQLIRVPVLTVSTILRNYANRSEAATSIGIPAFAVPVLNFLFLL